jgi:hypothetical protein
MNVGPDGEISMMRHDGKDDGWKTENGDGSKLVSKFNTEIPIMWDSGKSEYAYLKDANTIVVTSES